MYAHNYFQLTATVDPFLPTPQVNMICSAMRRFTTDTLNDPTMTIHLRSTFNIGTWNARKGRRKVEGSRVQWLKRGEGRG